MDVILTESKLPKKCSECRFYDGETERKPICRAVDEYIQRNVNRKKEKYCPLKTVDGMIEAIKEKSLGKWFVGRVDGKSEDVIPTETVIEIIKKYCEMEKKNDKNN